MSLRTAYLRMHRRADAHFTEGGLTADQFVLLNALADDCPTTQRALADRIACDPNTLRAMLLLLERRCLIVRDSHPTDGRARLVSPTPEGLALRQRLWESNAAFRRSLVDVLGDAESATFIDHLKRFGASLAATDPRTKEPVI